MSRAAIRSNLASWLKGQLISKYPDLKVLPQWPEAAERLQDPTIAISSAKSQREERHEPTPWATVATTGNQGTCTFSVGRAWLEVQIDLWPVGYQDARDKLIDDITLALAQDPSLTATGGPASPPPIPACVLVPGTGLVLPIPELYGSICEYNFEPVADITESRESVQTGDWRAMWSGTALFYLMRQQTVYLMKSIVEQIAMNGAPAENRSAP